MKRARWNDKYSTSELLWTATPNRFLVAEVAGLEPGRALDLACGEGRNAVWLAEQGWNVVGVDFAEIGLQKAAQLAEQRGVDVSFVHADLLDYEPAPGGFDLVCILYLQLPEAEMRPVLARAAAAVAGGGTFLLVGHDRTNLEHGHGGPDDPDVLLDPDEVVSALQGLRIEKAERVLRPVAGAQRPAIDTLVRASRPS